MAQINENILASGRAFLKDKQLELIARLEGASDETIAEILEPLCDHLINDILAECVDEALSELPNEIRNISMSLSIALHLYSVASVPVPPKPAATVHNSGKRGRKAPKTSYQMTICPHCDKSVRVMEFIAHLEMCMYNTKHGSQRVINNNLKRKNTANNGFSNKKNLRRNAKRKQDSLETDADEQSQSQDSVEAPLPVFTLTPPKKKGKHNKSPK